MVIFYHGIVLSQNDSISGSQNNLSGLGLTENHIDSVQYDSDSELIFITKYIGGQTMSLPTYFSTEEYRMYLFNKNSIIIGRKEQEEILEMIT